MEFGEIFFLASMMTTTRISKEKKQEYFYYSFKFIWNHSEDNNITFNQLNT